MMVFTLGIAIGSGIGGVGGGILAEKFGWRHALIIFSFASVPLLLMLMPIREPRRGANDASGSMPPGSSLRETLRFKIGRQSGREREGQYVSITGVAETLNKKQK